MAKKQYLDLTGLTTYDEQIKAYIDSADAATSTKLTNGTITVKEAEHADAADSATSATNASNADKLGGQLPSYYAKASDIPTGALADKDIVSESDLDSALAAKVNAAAEGNHSHSNKTVLDGITAAKVAAWDSAEANAKSYADSAASTAANKVKDDLLNGAGTAYDTLKELGDLIDDNVDAIEALEAVAAGKADAEHDHAIADVTGLQTALDAKAAQSSLDSHTGNTTVHITATERTNWNAAKTHADSAHAPSNAQANVIETIKVNGTALTPSSKAVDITVPTNYLVAADIANKADKATTLAGYGITNAYTKTEVDNKLSAKANQTSLDSVSSVANEAKTASAANTTAIGSNTSAISALTGRVATLEGLDTHEAIPTASITALFA